MSIFNAVRSYIERELDDYKASFMAIRRATSYR
jgi:hypothetical protein